MAAPDPIMGLTEAFLADPNPEKINLGAGVYKDASGKTPVLKVVKEAERRILESETSKGYLPMPGSAEYSTAVQRLLFGDEYDALAPRCATAHTPGGTGALRVVGDFLHRQFPQSTLWLSQPTWPNHPKVFEAAGVPTKAYAYFDTKQNAVNFEAVLADLQKVPAGDVVLLHGCCHNPTGADPSNEAWTQIAEVFSSRGVLPLLDFAYQGFADGICEDAVGLRALTSACPELIICGSFSKNFGLYRERVGALTLIAEKPEATARAFSQLKTAIRTNYSNPPSHGGAIVSTVLGDAGLSKAWKVELAEMRDRINQMRGALVAGLSAQGVDRDFSFIKQQRGMFSFSGLTGEQVDRLREEHSIYAVRSGRINVAGITEANIERLCEGIAAVL
jgi:aspartate/tyrosine/aromatic aminotransferase